MESQENSAGAENQLPCADLQDSRRRVGIEASRCARTARPHRQWYESRQNWLTEKSAHRPSEPSPPERQQKNPPRLASRQLNSGKTDERMYLHYPVLSVPPVILCKQREYFLAKRAVHPLQF